MKPDRCSHAGSKRARKERVLVAIWEGWRDGRPMTTRQVCTIAGYLSAGSVDWRKLEMQGWITRSGNQTHHAVMPGPRFGGVYQGKPMRIIEDDDVEEADTRAPKYDRRRVLFEVA